MNDFDRLSTEEMVIGTIRIGEWLQTEIETKIENEDSFAGMNEFARP